MARRCSPASPASVDAASPSSPTNHFSLGGAIDAPAGDKGERFITFADAFGLPLVFLTDNPGVMAGTAAERSGVLTRAGRMFVAQQRATVPKLQVTLRKAYGFGSTVMAMNPFSGQTLNAAFPGVTFGAMPTRWRGRGHSCRRRSTGGDAASRAGVRLPIGRRGHAR